MDQIDYSISIGRHLTDNKKIIGRTWENFFEEARNKKVILYGISETLNFLWLRKEELKEKIKIAAAVDNDRGKQNLSPYIFFEEKDLKELKIMPKSELKKFKSDEVVILISSLRYYQEIAEELNRLNYKNFYSVLEMEKNYRENNNEVIRLDEYKKKYAEECSEKYPIEQNKIIFYGFGGYADHEKYITEALLRKNQKLKLVWIVKKFPVEVPKDVEIVFNGNIKKYIKEMETAKIWIYDVPIETELIKRPGQIYIQTKHWGSITLKKFYLDTPFAAQVKDNKYYWEKNAKWMDYIISGSEFDEQSCRSGFKFNGKFLRFGSARSDAMFKEKENKIKITEKFKLKLSDKILLYAPTFRFRNAKNGDIECVAQEFLNFEELKKALEEKFNGEWKILLRLHPNLRTKKSEIPKFVTDVTDYDDNQELAAAADIMISDYSSIMFEPAYVLKPIFLYAPDLQNYLKNERELLIDYESLPFPTATNDKEMTERIKEFDEERYKKEVKKFLEKYGVKEDGKASERAANFIIKMIGE